MQKLAVVYYPKIDLDKINDFRMKYDPNWQRIPPHITIVSPVSEISDSQLLEHAEESAKKIKPFSIHLKGLTKTFDDYLFLLVKEGNEEIVHLHDKLYSGILTSHIPTDYPFHPHITLGYFRKNDNTFNDVLYAKAYEEAQGLNFDITCDFDSVSIIKGEEINPPQIIKTIYL